MVKERALRGVNLGGWLIPENWLTPSLFKGVSDMYELASTEEGAARLKHHFDTFITESDMKWLHDHQVEIIRIPVGYWLFDGDPPYSTAVQHLDWAMKMAERYDMRVLIDLHAVKGSQNGKVHSGRTGKMEWQTRRDFQEQTIETLVSIAKRYNSSPSFWGIELINEPKLGRFYFTLLKFYRRAYKQLRAVLRPGVYTVFHDAFHPILFNGALLVRRDHPVVLDVHWYLIAPRLFGRLSLKSYERIQRLLFASLLRWLQWRQPVIIGEWSSVLPQNMFNHAPASAHYDLLAKNIASQQKIYKRSTATMYWSYKAEGEGMWNFRSLVEAGVLMIE